MCSQTNTRKTRNVKHEGLSLQGKRYVPVFYLECLGVGVVNSLVIYAISRASSHQIPQIIMFTPDSSSLDLYIKQYFSVNRILP